MRCGDLVRDVYAHAGFSVTQAVAKIHLESGVYVGGVRAAIYGRPVSYLTAARLARWAKRVHGVELDVASTVAGKPGWGAGVGSI